MIICVFLITFIYCAETLNLSPNSEQKFEFAFSHAELTLSANSDLGTNQ